MIPALTTDIRLFSLQDQLEVVLDYLYQHELAAAFVVEDGLFLGGISITVLESLESSKNLSEYTYLLRPDSVFGDLHWLHVLEHFSTFKTNILAVVDDQQRYIGAYRFDDLSSEILNLSLIKQAGYIIVINFDAQDANYTTIVELVERNGGNILGLLPTVGEEHLQELTLKIAIQNSDRVVEALSRAGYQLTYTDASDLFKETLKDHAAYFNAYLNL